MTYVICIYTYIYNNNTYIYIYTHKHTKQKIVLSCTFLFFCIPIASVTSKASNVIYGGQGQDCQRDMVGSKTKERKEKRWKRKKDRFFVVRTGTAISATLNFRTQWETYVYHMLHQWVASWPSNLQHLILLIKSAAKIYNAYIIYMVTLACL